MCYQTYRYHPHSTVTTAIQNFYFDILMHRSRMARRLLRSTISGPFFLRIFTLIRSHLYPRERICYSTHYYIFLLRCLRSLLPATYCLYASVVAPPAHNTGSTMRRPRLKRDLRPASDILPVTRNFAKSSSETH